MSPLPCAEPYPPKSLSPSRALTPHRGCVSPTEPCDSHKARFASLSFAHMSPGPPQPPPPSRFSLGPGSNTGQPWTAPHLKLAAIEEYLPSVPTRTPSALFPTVRIMCAGSLGTGLISGAPQWGPPHPSRPYSGSWFSQARRPATALPRAVCSGACQSRLLAPPMGSHTFSSL